MEHKSGKKNRKFGRNEKKCQAYFAAKRRERNKLKRIRQSNGEAAAVAYKHAKGIQVVKTQVLRTDLSEDSGVVKVIIL